MGDFRAILGFIGSFGSWEVFKGVAIKTLMPLLIFTTCSINWLVKLAKVDIEAKVIGFSKKLFQLKDILVLDFLSVCAL